MRKVMTLVGTRPELIKMSRVIAELDVHTQHVLVHSGQNYDFELNEVFFDDLGIRKPDHFLAAAGATPAKTICEVITRVDDVLEQQQPEAFLVYGDTNTCLAVIAAKRRKIPVFHMEAGNRCFDERVPEELNRKVVDHLSDVNLTYTEHARRYLLAEGLHPDRVIKTGSPMKEVISWYRGEADASTILSQLQVQPRRYLVVSAHREENVDVPARFAALIASVNALAATYDMPIAFS